MRGDWVVRGSFTPGLPLQSHQRHYAHATTPSFRAWRARRAASAACVARRGGGPTRAWQSRAATPGGASILYRQPRFVNAPYGLFFILLRIPAAALYFVTYRTLAPSRPIGYYFVTSFWRGFAVADPLIYTHLGAFLQRIADAARTHSLYVTGTTNLKKIPNLIAKFEQRYTMNWQTGKSRVACLRARRAGNGTARWVGYLLKNEVVWVLLYAPGTTTCVEEKWRKLTDKQQRLQVLGYELFRQTRTGAKQPVWTWRWTKATYAQLRQDVLDGIRKRQDSVLKTTIDRLHTAPGFAGIREQAARLRALLKDEWKRRRRDEPMPEIPKRLWYIRRLADDGNGERLSVLLKARPSGRRGRQT